MSELEDTRCLSGFYELEDAEKYRRHTGGGRRLFSSYSVFFFILFSGKELPTTEKEEGNLNFGTRMSHQSYLRALQTFSQAIQKTSGFSRTIEERDP
ncbi:MAG: hypothetical protein AB7F88_05205 [Pyrinomonadaceae bacterium]